MGTSQQLPVAGSPSSLHLPVHCFLLSYQKTAAKNSTAWCGLQSQASPQRGPASGAQLSVPWGRHGYGRPLEACVREAPPLVPSPQFRGVGMVVVDPWKPGLTPQSPLLGPPDPWP